MTCACTETSRAETGSSRMISRGWTMSARAAPRPRARRRSPDHRPLDAQPDHAVLHDPLLALVLRREEAAVAVAGVARARLELGPLRALIELERAARPEVAA